MRLPDMSAMPFVLLVLAVTFASLLVILICMGRSCGGIHSGMRFVLYAFLVASLGAIVAIDAMYDRSTALSVIPVLLALGAGLGFAIRFGVDEPVREAHG